MTLNVETSIKTSAGPFNGSRGDFRIFNAASIDPFGRFLKLADVMKSIGVSQAMVYKLMKDETRPFPKPIKVGRAALWVERDVVAWKAKVVSENEGLNARL